MSCFSDEGVNDAPRMVPLAPQHRLRIHARPETTASISIAVAVAAAAAAVAAYKGMPGNRKAAVSGSVPKDGLGRALTRPRKNLSGRAYRRQRQHELEDSSLLLLPESEAAASVLDRVQWVELLARAELAGRDFTAEPALPVQNVVSEPRLVSSTDAIAETLRGAVPAFDGPSAPDHGAELPLTIPERPVWNRGMTAEQLAASERQAFHRWRASMDALEQQLAQERQRGSLLSRFFTPYEKNLQIWRQLWRVLERSELVIQVLDARHPLLFYSPHLERYLQKRHPEKKCILLLNKADLLTPAARRAWKDYFAERNQTAWFFSALYPEGEKSTLEPAEGDESRSESGICADEHAASGITEIIRNSLLLNGAPTGANGSAYSIQGSPLHQTHEAETWSEPREAPDAQRTRHSSVSGDPQKRSPNANHENDVQASNLCSRTQLMNLVRRLLSTIEPSQTSSGPHTSPQHRRTVGFVGYPNVGKSSTLNCLLGKTQAAVGPNPGKTKHFQTLTLDEDLMLCDAPGLVFPQWAHSRAELICAGVIPIDHAGDLLDAVQFICSRLPASKLASHYSLTLPPKFNRTAPEKVHCDAATFLDTLALARGFRTSHAQTDRHRAARLVLKDYVRGDLPDMHWPPVPADGVGKSTEAL
jgi:large subunit GTPase 1